MRAFQLVFCIHLHKKRKNLWTEEWKVNISKRELQPEKGEETVRQHLGSLSRFTCPETDSGKEPNQGMLITWEHSEGMRFCKLLTNCLTLISVMIPDGVTEDVFVTLSLAPVFIFQAT